MEIKSKDERIKELESNLSKLEERLKQFEIEQKFSNENIHFGSSYQHGSILECPKSKITIKSKNKNSEMNTSNLNKMEEKLKLLESFCKELYKHIQPDYFTRFNIKVPPELESLNTTKHEIIENYKDAKGNICRYEGGTIDNIPHGKGMSIYKDRTEAGSYLNGLKHGETKIVWNKGNKFGLLRTETKYNNGKPDGYQMDSEMDGSTVQYVYDNGKPVFMQKQIYRDKVVYLDHNPSDIEFYQLIYNPGNNEILVLRNEGDKEFISYKKNTKNTGKRSAISEL